MSPYLPSAPNDEEKLLFLTNNRAVMYLVGIPSTVAVLIGAVLFGKHSISLIWYLAFVFLIAFYLLISYLVGVFSRPFCIRGHGELQRKFAEVHPGTMPTVDIFLPSAGEGLHILRNTFENVARLVWAPGKIRVYVLDDSARAEVQRVAESFGFIYLTRPNRGELKKAGNIRYGFKIAEGEFMAIFDADFCPRHDFLTELMPYLIFHPQVGIVQSPQFFEVLPSMTWIQRGAGSVQELFYRLIEVNRDHWQGSICVGSNAIYRRTALEPYGGTYPIEHSEDVHTGFNLLKDGWLIKYVPVNLAKGICPDTFSSFFTQQYRWCMGSASLLFNRELFWKTKLKPMQRLSFLSGMLYYFATALGVFLSPIPGLIMVWFYPKDVFWFNSLYSLPSFLFGFCFMRFWNRTPYGIFTMKTRFVSYYAHVFALWDKLAGSTMPWIPTGMNQETKKVNKVALARRLMLGWNCFYFLLGITGAVLSMKGVFDYDFYPYMFVTTVYFSLHLSCLMDNGVKMTLPWADG